MLALLRAGSLASSEIRFLTFGSFCQEKEHKGKIEVNDIFLDIWAKRRYVFTSGEYNTLLGISLQSPNKGGPAVYTARVMLGISPENMQHRNLWQSETEENEKLVNTSLLAVGVYFCRVYAGSEMVKCEKIVRVKNEK